MSQSQTHVIASMHAESKRTFFCKKNFDIKDTWEVIVIVGVYGVRHGKNLPVEIQQDAVKLFKSWDMGWGLRKHWKTR